MNCHFVIPPGALKKVANSRSCCPQMPVRDKSSSYRVLSFPNIFFFSLSLSFSLQTMGNQHVLQEAYSQTVTHFDVVMMKPSDEDSWRTETLFKIICRSPSNSNFCFYFLWLVQWNSFYIPRHFHGGTCLKVSLGCLKAVEQIWLGLQTSMYMYVYLFRFRTRQVIQRAF